MDEIPDQRTKSGTAGARTTDTDDPRDGPERDVLLEAVVVRYSADSDRCTLVPRDGPPEAMLTAWLSADLETVVDLEDAR